MPALAHVVAGHGRADLPEVREHQFTASVKERGALNKLIRLDDRLRRAGVIAACGQALMPGGWLLVIDETYPETLQELRAPESRFAVQTGFEELHWGNVIPTRREQLALLAAAGFAAPEISVMGEGFTIIRAQRPANQTSP